MKTTQWTALCFFVGFLLWTLAVSLIDVQVIGPNGSAVGLATVNNFFHNFTGVHMTLYVITDWLGLIPLGTTVFFAALGLLQWIQHKSIVGVDKNLLLLGGFYLIVFITYAFFEVLIVNYRPVLINDILEASYPSSTTLLTICVMATTWMQLRIRINNHILKTIVCTAILLFTIFMVLARFLSGVHWFSDIIGGILFSAGLILLYRSLCDFN